MDEEALAAADRPLPDEVRPASTESEASTAETTEEAAASTDETGDETAADADADAGEQPKKAKGVQKRLDELTRQREEAKRERDHWREMAMRNGQKPETPAAPATAAAPEAPPRQEDYQTYEDFVAAKARFEVRQEIKAEQERERQTAAQREKAGKLAGFQEQAAKAREQHEDFDAVVFSPATPINQAMMEVIVESEKGADVAYYLGTHLDEAKRIAALSPLAAARELGRIEASLSMPAPRKTTKAPDPVKPVTGGSDVVRKNPAEMSMEEYRAARERGDIR